MDWRTFEKTMDYKRAEAYTTLPLGDIPAALGLAHDCEYEHMKKHNPSALNYSGNGSWQMYFDEGFWHISINVGCHCEHDCCGHMCSVGYNISPEPDNMLRIEAYIGYNF